MITDDITLDSLSTSPDKVLIRRRPRSAATRTLITIFTMPEAPPAPRPAAPAPLLRLTPGTLWAGGGVLGLCYSIACEWREWRYKYTQYRECAGVTVGLVHLDSCPRHPLLSVWLLVQVLYCIALYCTVLYCTAGARDLPGLALPALAARLSHLQHQAGPRQQDHRHQVLDT